MDEWIMKPKFRYLISYWKLGPNRFGLPNVLLANWRLFTPLSFTIKPLLYRSCSASHAARLPA